MEDNMKLNWVQTDKDSHRYEAVTPRFRFTMVAPPRAKSGLMVQHATAERIPSGYECSPLAIKVRRTTSVVSTHSATLTAQAVSSMLNRYQFIRDSSFHRMSCSY